MAIAPSKLGLLVAREWHSDDGIISRLKEKGLLHERALESLVRLVIQKARDEHAATPKGARDFNSPEERVRVLLAPLLSVKGEAWAEPLVSLKLPE